MNNLLSYCGLVDAKIRASDKDLPVLLTKSEAKTPEFDANTEPVLRTLQVNLFQKPLFLGQLTHNMTEDCS